MKGYPVKSTNTKAKKPAVATKKPAAATKKPASKTKKPASKFTWYRKMSDRKKLIAALLIVVVVFGAIGSWQLNRSDALIYSLSSSECTVRGRVYRSTDGACLSACVSGAGTYVSTASYTDYCTGALSTSVSKTYCEGTLLRKYRAPGCARRWQQTEYKGAVQCINSAHYYHITDPYDKCNSSTPPPQPTGWVNPINASVGNGWHTAHWAVDFPASAGTPVKAVNNGTVAKVGSIGSGCGNGIIIKTTIPGGKSVFAVYEHVNYSVGYGDAVKTGQQIATVQGIGGNLVLLSNGGCTTGAHLHFHIITDSSPSFRTVKGSSAGFLNPCNYLTAC